MVNRRASKALRLHETAKHKPRKLGAFAIILMGAIAVALAYMGCDGLYHTFQLRQLESAERAWQTVDATIVTSSVRSSTSRGGRMTWWPSWTYSYAVAGRTYLSRSTALPGGYDAHWYSSKQLAEQDAASRAVGSGALAYYDPADPQRSVLDRRTPSFTDWIPFLLAVMFLALAALFIVGLCVSQKRRRTLARTGP